MTHTTFPAGAVDACRDFSAEIRWHVMPLAAWPTPDESTLDPAEAAEAVLVANVDPDDLPPIAGGSLGADEEHIEPPAYRRSWAEVADELELDLGPRPAPRVQA